jgi:diadenosine tetraphosphate (Ap4A) HIT family hydrolase
VFSLDPRLERDTQFICDLDLCQVRLLNDRRFPWLVLIPRLVDASEIHDLDEHDALTLMRDTRRCATALKSCVPCDKINIAALGNKVRQLHVHVIARVEGDAAWPGAVWDKGDAIPYADDAAAELRRRIESALT